MRESSDHYSYRLYADPVVARSFDTDRFGGLIGTLIKEKEESLIFTMLPDVSGWKVIDVGAGTGRLTLPFLTRGATVTACDASPHMLEILNEKTNHPRLTIIVCDAHRLDAGDQEFDCAINSRMLMHALNWKRVLAELCRVSKDWVIFDFPPRHYSLLPAPFWHILRGLVQKNVQKYRTFGLREMRKEVERNGFEVVHVDHGFFLPMWVHRKISSRRFTTSIESWFRSAGLTRFAGSPLMYFARRKKECGQLTGDAVSRPGAW
jgi:ubiquinone/menaquinone biosynthesis C-methylase UbiE